MKIYVIYRLRYGEDFIIDSIKSIVDSVDKIFIYYTTNNFGGVTTCNYKGEVITIPEKIDDSVSKVSTYIVENELYEKVYLTNDSRSLIVPDNQFTYYANLILEHSDSPDMFMFIEHDMVWREDQLKLAIKEAKNHFCSCSRQVELWRTPAYRIPERQRYSCIFWTKAFKNGEFPMTNKSGSVLRPRWLKAFVHNFGFCMSEKNMYWKHLLAIAYSKKIEDSIPNENWYEDRWLNWDFVDNNVNLEIAKGYESLIPYALPYPERYLPVITKRK